MKAIKLLIIPIALLAIAACKQAPAPKKQEPADTAQTMVTPALTYDSIKVADLSAKAAQWSVTPEDYLDLIVQSDSILSYFAGKYTRAEIAQVQSAVLHEAELLGPTDYELFKTFYTFDCNIAAIQTKLDSASQAACDTYMVHRRQVMGF